MFVLFLFYRRGKFLSCQDVGPKLLRIAASEDETIKEDGEPDVAKSEEPLACLEPRSLAKAPIVRLLLDSTFARVRLDRKATSISLLVVLGVRADGQKVLLAIKSMGGRAPKLGAPSSTISSSAGCGGPSSSLPTARRGSTRPVPRSGTAYWSNAARFISTETFFAHAPERLHDEITADYNDMICNDTRGDRGPQGLHPQMEAQAPRCLPTAWKRQETACSPSRACRRTNGAVYATQMQSSVCTRNLSDGSRRRRDVVLGAARLHRGLLLCSNHMRRCAAIERQTSSVGRY